MSEEAAISVGWNSIKDRYEQTSNGEWRLKPEDPNIHNKSTQSGGNYFLGITLK